MPTSKHNKEILTAALSGFAEQKRRIDVQIAELRGLLTGGQTEPATEPAGRKRRKMSAAGRKAIAEAQRKRWAATKSEKALAKKAPAKRAKRKMSAAGRAAIAAAQKKRWAEKKMA